MAKSTEKVIIAVILLVGAILRIFNYWDFSLSNDELSALARLNFSSFSDLIHQGVKIDGHPAAAQVILYYTTKLFGNNVAVVRFPFVVAGISAIYYMYQLGKQWISTPAGLLSAAVFATLSFPILYSRIARPYALGMLFTLMAAYYFIRIVKNEQETKHYFLLAISLALCGYSHYFSALTAAVIAISGTFLLTGKTLKYYLLALSLGFVLYVPYIPIFLHQLSLGGVGQWLGPPSNGWLWEHIEYVFNNSKLALASVLSLGILGYALFNPKKTFVNQGLPLVLFAAPFLVGFGYSKWVNPVLQHSTLLFSFPFLLVFIFSGWGDSKPLLTKISVGLISITICASTIIEKRFYSTNHFGVFKEIAEHMIEWDDESGGNSILIGDFNYPFYLHYYTDRLAPMQLDLYRTTDEKGLAKLKSIVSDSKKETLIYGWSTVNQSLEVEEIIRMKFPDVIERETYFNSGAVRFRSGIPAIFSEIFEFEKNEKWNFNPDAIETDSTSGKWVNISASNPYGPTLATNVSSLYNDGIREVIVLIECSELENNTKLQMVYEQVNEDGGYGWESDEFNKQFELGGPLWGVFHYRLKEPKTDTDILKVYPWLPEGQEVKLKRIAIRFR